MRKRTLIAPLLAAASLAPALPADAAGIALTDPAGDANWVQTIVTGVPVPYSHGPADITKATISTVYKKVGTRKVATAVKATLTLADAPNTQGSFWYVVGGTVNQTVKDELGDSYNCTRFEFNLRKDTAGTVDGELRTCDPDGAVEAGSAWTKVPTKVSGNTITWTVPLSTLKKKGIKAGAALTDFYSRVYFYNGVSGTPAGLGFPQIDLATSALRYSIGK